jgi:hypothetical protein
MVHDPRKFNITTVRHPHYIRDSLDWETWRDTFEGGEYYRDHYLVQFSGRETNDEFIQRRELTPIPTFAKSAILDVRNNIYQRLVGVTRVNGPKTYQDAILGKGGGVDGDGTTMDTFIGKDCLTELLLMGKVGVYVDAAPPEGPTLADRSFPPYLTFYRVEDILSYSKAPRGKGGEFQSVLLRDYNVTVEGEMGSGITLPNGSETQYRLVWKDEAGIVWFKLFDTEGEAKLHEDGDITGAVATDLKRVPFVMFDIGDSLMKDVASYQKSLLNLVSNDVFYAIKSNTPFLTIQRDAFASGDHLKGADSAEGGSGSSEDVGAGKGRYYGVNEDRPDFIAPPTDPLKTSMQLQERLEDSIRTLINLSVASKAGSRTESAESKKVSQGGLEAGLSFIGLELEAGEKTIADIWAEYENVKNPTPATVKYPDRYTLKSDMERLEEAEQQIKLIEKLPTQELKRTVSKGIVENLLGGTLPQSEIDKINRKIDSNPYILSDPQVTLQAHKEGLVSTVTASEALGYDGEKEVEQAKEDRAERLAATIVAQTPGGGSGVAGQGLKNPASRGAPELDTNPNSGSKEKESKDNKATDVPNPGPPKNGN